jgi:hypothetical protein
MADDPRRAAVDALAEVLMMAWAKAEPDHPITKHPTSYKATFADMARTALAAHPLLALLADEDRAVEILAHAIADPGDFLPRRQGRHLELAQRWSARAVLAALREVAGL